MRAGTWTILALAAAAYAQSPEMNAVNEAAEALGGKDKILSLKTLQILGYGQLAYQDGGGNITASPYAPQKWINVNNSRRTIDLEHGRMRLEQRQAQDFVFAYAAAMTGANRLNQVLDGDVAFNVGPNGPQRAPDAAVRARRIEMLDNPVGIVRAALDPATTVSHLRRQGGWQIVNLTTGQGDSLTLALDSDTHLPAWVSWVGPDGNLGDVAYRTYFVGYQDEKGVMLPAGYNTVMDFRDVVYSKLYVDKYVIDGPAGDLAAPPAVRAATAAPRPFHIEVVPMGKGVWYLRGGAGNSTLYEFSDHLTLFECYGNEASTLAVIAKARTVVPDKPVTECIVSHHHFDHSGGLRAAVSEGLTIITQRGNVELFQELVARPATIEPDALARNPKPLKIRAVDKQLVLKDGAMEVQINRVISNSHMANGLFAYTPSLRLISEGDLSDEGWDIVFWGNSYRDSVNYWKLAVDRVLSVHGNMHTHQEVLEFNRKQTQNAQELCAKADAAGFVLQGCPVNNTL